MQPLTFAVLGVQSILMNGQFFLYLFLAGMLFCFGCQLPPEQSDAYAETQGIKLSDLQAIHVEHVEPSLSFSVLSYALDANSIDAVQGVADLLSKTDVGYDNAAAFRANGFLVSAGLHQEGAAVARKLQSIGAVRIGQGNMTIPSGSDEILYGVDIPEPRTIVYSASRTELMDVMVGRGRLGWVISPQKDPMIRGLVHLTLTPASWQAEGRDLRLLEGKEAYRFRFFDAGRVHLTMEAGQLFLLAPRRIVRDRDTLDRVLFETPLPDKVRLFVIVCGTAGD